MPWDGLRNQHSEMAVRQKDATFWFCEMPKAFSFGADIEITFKAGKRIGASDFAQNQLG